MYDIIFNSDRDKKGHNVILSFFAIFLLIIYKK
jgi:hypothetical protein